MEKDLQEEAGNPGGRRGAAGCNAEAPSEDGLHPGNDQRHQFYLVEPTKTGMVKKDGQIVWTEMSAVPVALPGWKVIVVILNLSEQPGAEETPPKPGDGQ